MGISLFTFMFLQFNLSEYTGINPKDNPDSRDQLLLPSEEDDVSPRGNFGMISNLGTSSHSTILLNGV